MNKILIGDAIEKLRELEDESVQMCVTSPPYWGLRDYGNDDQLGLEKTPNEFVKNLVAVFREVKRVLKNDGTLWLNLGDTYSNHKDCKSTGQSLAKGTSSEKAHEIEKGKSHTRDTKLLKLAGLKNKDLVGIPWRVAFALQADGWYLRQDIIWAKPNPMPESVTDRCTKSHEYIFLLSKSPKYYFDNEAIAEDLANATKLRGESGKWESSEVSKLAEGVIGMSPKSFNKAVKTMLEKGTRNRRSVWTINTKPFSGAHFAVFPPEIPELCIKAGTSEKGCCEKCGKPWDRVVEKKRIRRNEFDKSDPRYRPNQYNGSYEDINGKGDAGYSESKTTGWEPGCECGVGVIPCVVLDPFFGSGTTGLVAKKAGRKYIGIELNPTYAELSEERLSQETLF